MEEVPPEEGAVAVLPPTPMLPAPPVCVAPPAADVPPIPVPPVLALVPLLLFVQALRSKGATSVAKAKKCILRKTMGETPFRYQDGTRKGNERDRRIHAGRRFG
jgi:hypothetical protein